MNDIKSKELSLLDSDPFFDVELSSLCNVDCIMCPRDKLARKKELMPLEIIEALVDWFPDNARVMLCGLGEPFLNRNIHFLLSALKEKNIVTGITTNGLLLTKNNIDFIVENSVNLLQISFNGSTKDIYSSIMKNSSFDKVIDNLKYLAKVKPLEIEVKLAITVQDGNKHDIKDIEKFAESLNFGVFLRNCHSRAGAIESTGAQKNILPGCGILPKVTFIATNGGVLSCCQDLSGSYILGNVDRDSFTDIVEKKKKIIEDGQWFPICKNCDDEYRYLLLSGDIT